MENLNKIIELLEKNKVNLEELVQERNTSGTACMYCFPLGSFEEASSSKSTTPKITSKANIISYYPSFQISCKNMFDPLSIENEEEPLSVEKNVQPSEPLKKKAQNNQINSHKKV